MAGLEPEEGTTNDDLDDDSGELEPEEPDDDLFGDMDVPQGLDDVRKNMQRAFTKKTTALAEERKQLEREVEILKQKADMYDNLNADPEQAIEILSSWVGKSGKNRALDQDKEDRFAKYREKYGENADSMIDLISSITEDVTTSLSQQMSPLLQSSQEGAFKREMTNLSTWVKSQREKTGLELPDPDVLEPTIRDRMNRKGDTAIEAYKASMNLDRLNVRKSLESSKKKTVSTFQPGGTNKGLPKKLGLTTDDAIERRKQGKKPFTIDELRALQEKGEL